MPREHAGPTVSPASVGEGDVTNRHNLLYNAVYEACHQASLSVRLDASSGLGKDKVRLTLAQLTCWSLTPVGLLVLQSIILEARVSAGIQQPKQLKYKSTPNTTLSALNSPNQRCI